MGNKKKMDEPNKEHRQLMKVWIAPTRTQTPPSFVALGLLAFQGGQPKLAYTKLTFF